MNYLHVSKQFQVGWLAEKPEIFKSYFSSTQNLSMLECQKNFEEAKECFCSSFYIEKVRNSYHASGNSITFFKLHDLKEKYTEIANMYSNFFGFKYSEDAIENKWKELKTYVEENNLLYLYA